MLKRSMLFGVLLILTVAVAGCGLLQEPAAPSATIEAVPLDVATEEPAAEPTEAVDEVPVATRSAGRRGCC
ncbi:MAG: hypothetical protein R3C44_24955 [Chloroflexota bacterium]